jgi:hypothetical protein
MTSEWDIVPYSGVGPLRFGLDRSAVRLLLGDGLSTFKKGTNASNETDAYNSLGLHLYYDDTDALECVEAFDGCSISYQDVKLLNENIQDTLKMLAVGGLSSRYDDGYFFDEPGFALFAIDNVVKAVTVYRRGYFDE